MQPRLIVSIHDLIEDVVVTRTLARTPALVGRGRATAIPLYRTTVSRYHGAFLFGPGTLQYVDLGSANGSWVDGALVAPDNPIDIRNSTTIDIQPYRLTVDVQLATPGEPDGVTVVRAVPRAETPLAPVLSLLPPVRPEPPNWQTAATQVTALLMDLLSKVGGTEILREVGFSADLEPTAGHLLEFLTDPSVDRIQDVSRVFTRLVERRAGTPAEVSAGISPDRCRIA
jgi:pSer/pThr/pTyr-binding forkhead associated (FHA) protein